jgi:hypothetical protein
MGIAVHAGRLTASSANMSLFICSPYPPPEGLRKIDFSNHAVITVKNGAGLHRQAVARVRKATTKIQIRKFHTAPRQRPQRRGPAAIIIEKRSELLIVAGIVQHT